MKQLNQGDRSKKSLLWLTGGANLALALLLGQKTVLAQTVFPSNPNIVFQTSGSQRPPGIGDWYTTTNPATASTVRRHEFFINVTADDLAAVGGQLTITVRDPASSTTPPIDEPPPAPGTPRIDEVFGTPDPTRFQLLGPGGAVLDDRLIASGADNRAIEFRITTPGVYTVTSQTGDGTGNVATNNDDNGFTISAPISNLLIGQVRGTFQNPIPGPPRPPIPFYFLVGPGTDSLFLRNFDLDRGAMGTINGVPVTENSTISYTRPSGASIPGSPTSQDALWNNGGTRNDGGDLVPGLDPTGDAGVWRIDLLGFGAAFTNQSLLQVNTGSAATPTSIIPIFDTPPQRAGNVQITPSPNPPTPVNQDQCKTFTVTNLFFVSDIINLELDPNDPNFTSQFRDVNGQNPVTDTDGDGRPDTGILQPNESRTYTLCVAQNPNAPAQLNTQIVGISFLDVKIRQQAGNPQPPTRRLAPVAFDFSTGGAGAGNGSGSAVPSFVLVKRITNVTRNGAVLPGVNFGAVIDDPGSADDNAAGWSQIPLTGVLAVPERNPVQSGDEVTYTVYFLSGGTAPALDVNICDLIPGGTTYVLGSLELSQNNAAPAAVGDYFTPLAPLPANNSCPLQTNPNGATVVQLGTVSNVAGSNFGFIRFRVRIN